MYLSHLSYRFIFIKRSFWCLVLFLPGYSHSFVVGLVLLCFLHLRHIWNRHDIRFDYVTKTRMSVEIKHLHARFTFKLLQILFYIVVIRRKTPKLAEACPTQCCKIPHFRLICSFSQYKSHMSVKRRGTIKHARVLLTELFTRLIKSGFVTGCPALS